MGPRSTKPWSSVYKLNDTQRHQDSSKALSKDQGVGDSLIVGWTSQSLAYEVTQLAETSQNTFHGHCALLCDGPHPVECASVWSEQIHLLPPAASRLSFLPSLTFAVPVSSTLGFLSLPLRWLFFLFHFHRGSVRCVGLLLCLASASQGLSQGCFSRVKYESQHYRCRGVCNFLGSVSLQQKFKVTDWQVLQPHGISSERPVLQLCVTAQLYLESIGKYILQAWGQANPKDTKRRKAPGPILAPLFCFFSPWACPL